MQRRSVLKAALATPLLASIAQPAWAQESDLIYLSPIKSDGGLSSCQAEIWYVFDGSDYYVVTGAGAWRARAITKGLTQAQIWVGNVGRWQQADEKWLQLPSFMASASIAEDPATHERLLTIFGRKYADEWGSWGPRFKKGLADGSRVMLKYSPA